MSTPIFVPVPCPEPGGSGSVADVESLILCDVVDDDVVGYALAVYEYDESGVVTGPPTFVVPGTNDPYVVVGTLQPCASGGEACSIPTSLTTGQGDVDSVTPTAYPIVPLADRVTIRYTNPHATVDIDFSEDSAKFALGQSDILMARSSVEIDLAPGETVYWLSEGVTVRLRFSQVGV